MKTIKILMMLLLTSVFFVSCGGPESDAEKTMKLTCEGLEIAKEHGLNSDEVKEFAKDNEKFEKELEEKYGTGADDEKGSASEEDKKVYWDTYMKLFEEGCEE